MVVIGMYLFLPKKPYISSSKIDGERFICRKNYKKMKLSIENPFYKDVSLMLFNPITKDKFSSYILIYLEQHINHCSRFIVNIISTDYRVFKLVTMLL